MTPPPTGSNLDFALAYYTLGWWVFPGRDPLDLQEFRNSLIRQGKSHEAAYQETERARKHTFVAWAGRRKMGEAGRPTETEIRDWFDESRPLRPVIILTGPGATAEGQLVGVDVDPDKGGDPAPWLEGATMVARTPSGGWHIYGIADDAEQVKTNSGEVAEGIDIRGSGGLLVAPSGEVATPGRTWERWGALSPAPLAEIRRRLAERRPPVLRERLAVAVQDDDVIPDAPAPRGFTSACLDPAPDGQRQKKAKALIGMLAREGRLPADAVAAALSLLRDWCEVEGVKASIERSLEIGWEAQLRAPLRSVDFALEVLSAWNNTRGEPPWPEERLEQQTRSIWQSAVAREAQRSAPAIAATPRGERAQVGGLPEGVVLLDEDDAPRGGVFEPPTVTDDEEYVGSAEEQASGQVEDYYVTEANDLISRATGRRVLTLTAEEAIEELLPSRRVSYGLKEFEEKLNTPILSCATLPPWMTITAAGVMVDNSNPHGHGFGGEFDVALAGGLRPGYFAVLGAKTAKAGKTALADQLIDGLLLRSLDVLAKLARGEQTKELIVVRYDLSEMPDGDITDRQLGRWFGVDSTTFRRGDQPHLAPGILRRAPSLHMTPQALAEVVLNAGRAAMTGGRFFDLGELQRTPKLDALPSASDVPPGGGGKFAPKPLNHQAGPLMLRRVVAQIKTHRRLLAVKWGVPAAQICPLLFVDPIQRFQGSNDSESVAGLDAFANALKKTAASLKAIVIATSDTNKDSASGAAKRSATSERGKDKGKDTRTQGEKVASTLRGSYGLTHAPDLTLVLAVDDEEEETKPGEPVKVRLITGANRWLRRAVSIPLNFEPETGRYTPRAEDAPAPSSAALDETLTGWHAEHEDPDGEDGVTEAAAALLAAGLSAREVEVVTLVGQGHSDPEVAERCKITASSVKQHVLHARKKLGLGSRDDLIGHLQGLE